MYWLLEADLQEDLHTTLEHLTEELAQVTNRVQADQLFPFVGRKDRRKARIIAEHLSEEGDQVLDPFAGSGTLIYGALEAGRRAIGNEWEPYTHRMASAPWRLPILSELEEAHDRLLTEVSADFAYLYATRCPCGNDHILDSLFFDRKPESFEEIELHERLGKDEEGTITGENVTYRRGYKCPKCGRTEKYFDESDREHLEELAELPAASIFDVELIENSRINLRPPFTRYGNLFPHRSRLALERLWDAIQKLSCSETVRSFLEDAFLAVIPQAKYKDYRSKSQDLHVPDVKLREVNILHRFNDQFSKRKQRLYEYKFSRTGTDVPASTYVCQDFREFLESCEDESCDLMLTDPPWLEVNPYFEKAQLYHPWLGYSLRDDRNRLNREMVVTDAPSRVGKQEAEQWWDDLDECFRLAYSTIKEHGFLVLYIRPTPAGEWLSNLNRLKLKARKNGFEPLLSIDVGSSDPSMRIQQSASYVFSKDMIFCLLRLEESERRLFDGEYDVDLACFRVAAILQEEEGKPFAQREWRERLGEWFLEDGHGSLNAPEYEPWLSRLFERYCEGVGAGEYLPRPDTPFSGQIFDTPAIERLFTYVPVVVDTLDTSQGTFSYAEFLLRLGIFVENGTRDLIDQVQDVQIRRVLERYAESVAPDVFRKRPAPTLPEGLNAVMDLGPYEFERFVGNLLDEMGFSDVHLIGRTGDRGVDLLGTDEDGKRTVVQCKRWVSNVGATPIQRLHSYAVTRKAARRICVVTSDFTKAGTEEADRTETELINGERLEALIATHFPDWNLV